MRGLQIVKNFPQKQHTLPAHVLLNASEDLFAYVLAFHALKSMIYVIN